MAVYLRPTRIDEALGALSERRLTILAGGTDFYPARVGQPLDDDVLDITAIGRLRGVEHHADHWRIPALTTWTDLIRAPLPPLFDGVKRAAREVGGIQIQNAGTVCGNLCNASPAADGMPPLLSLGAKVEIASLAARRIVPLEDFVRGNRETLLGPDQMVLAVRVPKPAAARALGHFVKLGARRYLVISILMVAVALELAEDGTITTARVALGACSPVARRLGALERALAGRVADAGLGGIVTAAHLEALAPIDDPRASAGYRLDAGLTLTRRALSEIGAMA